MAAKFTVCLMGAPLTTGNRGVSALSASLIKLISFYRPEAQIFLLAGHREPLCHKIQVNGQTRSVRLINYRLSPRAPFREQLGWIFLASLLYRVVPSRPLRNWLSKTFPWIGALAESDFVGDIRGGDSFSDIYGAQRFLTGAIVVATAFALKKRVVLLPQTYGPYKNPLLRHIARLILRRSSLILSRNQESIATVEGLLGTTERCRFCPDVAFSLDASLPASPAVNPPLAGVTRSNLIGLNVNGLLFRGGYTQKNMFGLKLDYPQFLLKLIERLLADETKHLLLVPHTFAPPDRVESDPAACDEVWRKLPGSIQSRVHRIGRDYDQSEIKGIIGLCDFFIGSRMHACIAALSQGIPAIGVAYSKKFKGVFETVRAGGSIIDGRELCLEDALHKAVELYANRESRRAELTAAVPQAREQLFETFEQLLAATEEPPRQARQLVLQECLR